MVTDTSPNMLDRAIAYVAPQFAYRRAVAREKMAFVGTWKGASRARAALAGWNPVHGTSADQDNSADLPTLRARSRDLQRSSPLAGGAIETAVTNVVGTGLSVTPLPDHVLLGISEEEVTAWSEHAKREFRIWAETSDCDITRTQNFYGLQEIAFRTTLASGDGLVIAPRVTRPGVLYSTVVQIIEADLISNPDYAVNTNQLADGVEKDQFGAPVAYHVADSYPSAGRSKTTWRRLDAFGGRTGRRQVLHLFKKTRPGQTRGVPFLAPVIEPLKQLDRYTDAELQAAVISGAFAVFVKMDPTAFNDLFGEGEGSQAYIDTAKNWDGSMPTGTLGGPGNAVNLLPGESIETANPGRPNAQFDPFFQAIVRQIGVALEIPFEVLIKHFTSSYTAARAALLDAWRFFRGRREWLVAAFCQPLYELWLDEAVATGRIAAPGYFMDPAIRFAWTRSVWVGDAPGSVDPAKEIAAARDRVALGVSTRQKESIAFDGSDWDDNHRQLVKEERARREDGLSAPLAPPLPQPEDLTQPDKDEV
jgi:lambda family phage portal protein